MCKLSYLDLVAIELTCIVTIRHARRSRRDQTEFALAICLNGRPAIVHDSGLMSGFGMGTQSNRFGKGRSVEAPLLPGGDRGISIVFFLSGASGLIFQVVWFERCGLVFGNSVLATSIVLSSFMAGLAVGNVLVARFWHSIAASPARLRHS